ncbi:hypothetical protein MTO96_046502, partial [Rhipicephalus appendiculatus]
DRKRVVEHPYYDGGHQTSHHNLYTHKYHNLYKKYDAVDYYFHRTANFSGTINSNCEIRSGDTREAQHLSVHGVTQGARGSHLNPSGWNVRPSLLRFLLHGGNEQPDQWLP